MNVTHVVSKLIIEVKFRPNFNYFSKLFELASQIESDFEEWTANHNPSQAILINESDKINLSVTADTIRLVCEDASKFSGLATKMDQYITLFLDDNGIKEIRRIGVRRISIYESIGKYADIVKHINNKMLGADSDIISSFSDSVEDSQFTFDSIKDGFLNHITFAPLKIEQLPAVLKSDFNKRLSLKKAANFLIDVDVYSESIESIERLLELQDAIIQTNSEIIDNLKREMFK